MSINAIAGYAHAFGLGGYGFGNSIPTQSPSQQGSGPSVAGILQQTQNTTPSSSDDGNDSEDAFVNALTQMAKQYNPSLQGVADSIQQGPAKSLNGTPSSGSAASGSSSVSPQGIVDSIMGGTYKMMGGTTSTGTTASGSGGTSTSSAGGSNATDATSSSQSSNPSILQFLGGALSAIPIPGLGLLGQALGAAVSGSTQASGATTSSSTVAATGSTSASSAAAAATGAPTTASELQRLLQSSTTTSASPLAGFGAWAQSMDQSMLSTLSALI